MKLSMTNEAPERRSTGPTCIVTTEVGASRLETKRCFGSLSCAKVTAISVFCYVQVFLLFLICVKIKKPEVGGVMYHPDRSKPVADTAYDMIASGEKVEEVKKMVVAGHFL